MTKLNRLIFVIKADKKEEFTSRIRNVLSIPDIKAHQPGETVDDGGYHLIIAKDQVGIVVTFGEEIEYYGAMHFLSELGEKDKDLAEMILSVVQTMD